MPNKLFFQFIDFPQGYWNESNTVLYQILLRRQANWHTGISCTFKILKQKRISTIFSKWKITSKSRSMANTARRMTVKGWHVLTATFDFLTLRLFPRNFLNSGNSLYALLIGSHTQLEQSVCRNTRRNEFSLRF